LTSAVETFLLEWGGGVKGKLERRNEDNKKM